MSISATFDRPFFDFRLFVDPAASCAAYASSVRAHRSFFSFFPFFVDFFLEELEPGGGSASSKFAGYCHRPELRPTVLDESLFCP